MRSAAIIIVGLCLVGGCDDSNNSAVDPVVSVREGDRRMAEAQAEARRRWPEFVTAFEQRESDVAYAVKFQFNTDGDNSEFVWIQVQSINGDQITGVIDNIPVADIGHNYGDTVTRSLADLNDWLIARGPDDITGGFTIKVLEEIEDGP